MAAVLFEGSRKTHLRRIAYNDVDKLDIIDVKNAFWGLVLLYSMKSDWKRLTALWLRNFLWKDKVDRQML